MKNDLNNKKVKCAICRVAIDFRAEGNLSFPFCSERCQMHDFGNWINESYSLPISQDSTERKLVADFSNQIGEK